MKKISYELLYAISFSLILCAVPLIIMIRSPKEISVLENRSLNKMPTFSKSGFLHGEFQEKMELALLDQFPLSQTLKSEFNNYNALNFKYSKHILGNISSDYNFWPVGNKVVEYTPTGHLITEKRNFDEYLSKLNRRVESYNEISTKYENIDLYIALFDRGDFLDDKINRQNEIDGYFVNNLNENIKYTSTTLKDVEQYTNYYFKTDYHWNNKGQYEGYKKIMQSVFSDREVLIPKDEVVLKKTKYVGSTTLSTGDKTKYDVISTYEFDLGEYTALKNGVDAKNKLGLKGLNISNDFIPEKWTNQYNEVFGYNIGEIVYEFDNNYSENAVVFVDSFSNPINELIAHEFKKSYFIDMRYFEDQTGIAFNLETYLKNKNITKIIIMGNAGFFIDDDFVIN